MKKENKVKKLKKEIDEIADKIIELGKKVHLKRKQLKKLEENNG